MNYIITGGAGHIAKPLAEQLLGAGHQITVIGRQAEHLKELTQKGAKAEIGSLEDSEFLIRAFAGADAVFTMVPPVHESNDWKAWIGKIGRNYARAIGANKIGHVVNLSSVGAHAPAGCGPVSGLHTVEELLDEIPDTNVLHLRPGYFFYNLMNNIGMIKGMGIMGANFGGGSFKLVMAAPADIARVAAEELLALHFTGHSVRYIASDERSTDEIASVIGKAIGKPDLKWVVFTDEQALQGMLQAGLPREIAANYAEMNTAFQTGLMTEDYWKHRPVRLERVKLEDFTKYFVAAYDH